MKTRRLEADDAGIQAAADLLCAGGLVAFGTETVYGLGADATRRPAIEAVFAAKGRPRHNPLIMHFADAPSALREVQAGSLAERLAERFWPGPLTLVLPRRPDSAICAQAAAGLDTLAVRVPAHRIARDLLCRIGRPVAAPSANRSGRVSPTTAEHVFDGLDGRIDAVLDCGPCAVGLESTVLAVSAGGATLLRPGAIGIETIAALLSAADAAPLGVAAPAPARPAAPGMLASHYAPRAALRLDATEVAPDEALLGFGRTLPWAGAGAGASWNLSEAGDLDEAAARLFAGLRWLDARVAELGLARIAVMPIPARGLGHAITDRLQRAAAPRPDTR